MMLITIYDFYNICTQCHFLPLCGLPPLPPEGFPEGLPPLPPVGLPEGLPPLPLGLPKGLPPLPPVGLLEDAQGKA